MIKKISALIIFLFLFAFSSSPTYALVLTGSKTIVPDGDTSVFSKNPDTNYGTVSYLSILNNASGVVWSWMHFDLSVIPANATITSATLKVFVNPSGSSYQVNGTVIDLYRNTADAYNEATATWNNVMLGGPKLANTLTYSGANSIETSVTDAVTAWWTGIAANKGFTLVTATPGGYCMLYSREAVSTADRPTLTVNYTTPLNLIMPLSTPTPTQTPQAAATATPTPTPTLTPNQTPTPTLTKTNKTSPTPTAETGTTTTESPDGLIQEPPVEEPKNENQITFSITANMVVAAIMIIAGLVLVALFIWLLKKKTGKTTPEKKSESIEEKSPSATSEVVTEDKESKDEETPKENEEK